MRKWLIGAVLAALAASPAGAAEMLPEVVVTAERVGVARKEEPQAVEVITEKDFSRTGAGNVSEALGAALSLDLSAGAQNSTSAMGGHQVQLRGMNTNHTLILVDGRRLADEDTSQTQNMYLLSRINLSQVDRIEILRGPAGAMYGSDAMGGVIQIITKKPGQQETSAGFRLSSRENEAHFRVDPGALGRFSFAVTGRIAKTRPVSFRQNRTMTMGGGIPMRYDGYYAPAYGVERYIGLDSLYDFQNANRNTLRLTLDYFDEDTKTRFADSSAMNVLLQTDSSSDTSRREWSSSLTYEGNTGKHGYAGRIYYSDLKKDSDTINYRPAIPARLASIPIPNSGTNVKQALETSFPLSDYDNARYKRWGAEAHDTISYAAHRVTYGAEYERAEYTGTRLAAQGEEGEVRPRGSKAEAGHDQYSGAFYVGDVWRAAPKWVLTPSVRFQKGNRYGFVGTPKIGVTYEMGEHARVKVNYGQGFRAPTISELYLHMNHGFAEVFGNPDLSPEKSRSYDLSLEWERGKTAGKISYFMNRVKNLIDTQHDGGSRYRYVNRKRADIQGVEAELSHALGGGWTAKAGYTYLDATDKSAGSRLENRARHQLTVSLDYDDGNAYGWSGKLWDTFMDQYYFQISNDNYRNYTYHLVNLAVQKHWGKELTLSAGLYNIGNKKIDDLYVDGREWFCGMEMKF